MFLLKKLRKKVEAGDRIGIAISQEGLSIVHVVPSAVGKPYLSSARFHSSASEEEYPSLVKKFIEELGLHGKTCVLVIPSAQYAAYMMEPPEVDDKEMKQALAWQVKDYLDYPVENASIDYIDLPTISGKRLVYAVAANKRFVEKQVAWLNLMGLEVEAVNIGEFALRNIASLLPENKKGLLFIHPAMVHSKIILVKDTLLYLLRDARVDLKSIVNEGYDIDDEVLVQMLEELSLEVQRTLDYSVTRLQQNPAESIVISPQVFKDLNESDKYNSLSNSASLPVRIMKLDEVFKIDSEIEYDVQCQTIIASGAALRYIDDSKKLR